MAKDKPTSMKMDLNDQSAMAPAAREDMQKTMSDADKKMKPKKAM